MKLRITLFAFSAFLSACGLRVGWGPEGTTTTNPSPALNTIKIRNLSGHSLYVYHSESGINQVVYCNQYIYDRALPNNTDWDVEKPAPGRLVVYRFFLVADPCSDEKASSPALTSDEGGSVVNISYAG